MNDYLAQLRRDGQWPALYSLAGVYPADWTPVDSLVVQGDLTQELDFTTTPLDYALLEKTLGPDRTLSWFPILPPGQQHPYDPGPYRNLGIAPVASTLAGQGPGVSAATLAADPAAGPPRRAIAPHRPPRRPSRRPRRRRRPPCWPR